MHYEMKALELYERMANLQICMNNIKVQLYVVTGPVVTFFLILDRKFRQFTFHYENITASICILSLDFKIHFPTSRI